jgi:large subunit ribosomal protein L25
MHILQVEKRSEGGATAAVLRREGKVPGVVYGAHHEATPIVISLIEFKKALAAAGEATVVSLAGLGEAVPTLIHEVDLDPLTSAPRHVDFYAITKGEKVQVHVPIEFVGESAAVKAGANLVKVLHEIEVEADPMQLPHDLKVDISALAALNDQIHVKDVKLPEGVTLVTSEDEVIVIAQEVAQEREEEVAADISEVEIEKKGKEEGAEEGAAEAE